MTKKQSLETFIGKLDFLNKISSTIDEDFNPFANLNRSI